MVADARWNDLSFQILFVRDLVDAHVGIVNVRQQAYDSILLFQESAVPLKFNVGGIGIAKIPNQVDSIGNRWQLRLTKTQAPLRALVFQDHAPGVATRVGCIVIGSVLVNGPVHELQVAVISD